MNLEINNTSVMRLRSQQLCKYLPVEISGQLILGLVDSGNIFYNVISDTLANSLNLTNKLLPYEGPPVGTAKSGELLKIAGIAKQVDIYSYLTRTVKSTDQI